MKDYDVVVIGAGNGGLVAAIRVLQAGYSCLLVEKHNIPGGFATSFKRGRFEFEASLHELNDFGSKEEPGDVRTLFRSLGVEDKIDWIRIDDAYHLITTDKKYDCQMPFGVENFINKMEEYCPGSRKSVSEFFELCEEVRNAQTYSNSVNGNTDSNYMKTNFPNFVKAGSYSVNEVLDTLKMPQKAKDILSAYWCYLGIDLDRMSFLHYGSMVLRYITRYAWMPKARSHEISLALDSRIRELGGDIFYNCEATKILVDDNNKIKGVELHNGKVVNTKHVIANCAPHVVFGKLLENKSITEQIIRATNSRKFSGRGYTLFLGLNKSAEELGIKSHNYFIYDTADSVKQYDLMKKIKTNHVQATVCLNNAYPECSPKGTCMMYFTTMFMSDDWGNVSDEDYYKMKDEVALDMINVFERETGCKIKDAIEEIAVASPTTYARYCGHPEGVIYGYETGDWDSLMPRLMMMKEDAKLFENLRFAGGYAMRSSGYSSAYISGDLSGRQTVGDLKREGK
ncbi:TPA: NAD(P)/FAD-dependent oxidoreductase [Candidatus Avacholeplasma faecigallinarum]|nr:NAD(P)/FAD-dependent oxidoreductase [Candidatus Avacholeplasma faecigallinarum]